MAEICQRVQDVFGMTVVWALSIGFQSSMGMVITETAAVREV